jgi:hypothetical protein
MALIEDTAGAGTVNGLKSLSLTTSTVPGLATTVNITGAVLVATGVVAIGAPLIILGTHYVIKRIKKNKDGSSEITAVSKNGKVFMSVIVASALMVSVGTAMLPRTQTVMIIHIIAGYTCLIVSIIHVYQYRKVINAQAKKYFKFLFAPKHPVQEPTKKKPAAPVRKKRAASASKTPVGAVS